MDKKYRQETFEKLDKSNSTLHNWILALEVIPDKYIDDINHIVEDIVSLRDEINKDEILTLYALKLYTEHRVSWERAGSISGKHIFGLQEYCNEHNVNYNNLRIDEYYDFTGEDAIKTIKEEWSKLDPKGLVAPVRFDGDSNTVFKSDKEYKTKHLHEAHYIATGRYVLTEFNVIYNESSKLFNDNEYSNTKYAINYLFQISKRLEVTNQSALDKWINTLQKSYELLNTAIEYDDVNLYNQSFENIIDNLVDGKVKVTVKMDGE